MKQDMIERAYARLEARRQDWSLDQPFYVDPDFFEIEMELFFARQWLFAAMTCEVASPGSWIRVDIGRDSVVILRRKDGTIGAFHNTCRHRGSRICVGESGVANRLVCPYHQWSYELDGRLARTRLMGPDFGQGDFGLVPVAVGIAGGYIFINFASDPADFEDFRQAVEPYILPHG